MMLEEDGVLGGQGDLHDGYDAGIQLEGAGGPVELGEVPEPGCLAPAAVGDRVAGVQRGAATVTRSGRAGALGMAPTALDPLVDVGHGGLTPHN